MASSYQSGETTEATHGIVREVATDDGEIIVYRDADGYHAELWSESRQMIVAQSGDCATEAEAVERVS